MRGFLKHERMTEAMNSASVSHHSFKKPDVMHTALQTEEYVDPPAPVNVNVAPSPAPSIGIADYLEPPVPLIQLIDMIPERAPVTKYVTPAPVIEVKYVSPSQLFPSYLLAAPVSEDVTPAPADSNTAPPTVTEFVTPAPVLELDCVSPSQQFSSCFMDAPVSEDVSAAPAGADTTTVTVTEYVMPAPVMDSNCVSQENSSLPWRPHLLEKVGGNVTLLHKSK